MKHEQELKRLKDFFSFHFEKFLHTSYPSKHILHEAQRFACEGGGKRIRPVMCLAACESLAVHSRVALAPAIALEMLHTYSLIHDDLPAMDDDDFRRGRPTLHRLHGDGQAILAGDGLLTDAFRVLTDSGFFPDNDLLKAAQKISLVTSLSRAAGSEGMVLGQSLDLLAAADMMQVHFLKTACLMGSACQMGALAAGADADSAQEYFSFGSKIGLAFQLVDDDLDAESEPAHLGQRPDMRRGRNLAQDLTAEAVRILEQISVQPQTLRFLAEHLLRRDI